MHSSKLSFSIYRVPSRPSSSTSNRSIPSTRARSPSLSLDDPVSIRHHMSTLKHSIRHQQAQLQTLENLLQRAPRMPITNSNSPPPSPLPDPLPSDFPPISPIVSFDVLQSLAGPDSNLPLPRRAPSPLSYDGIREGVPMDFGTGPSSQTYKRQPSPTRTLSRIPVSSVGNARALADDGVLATPPRYSQAIVAPSAIDPSHSNVLHPPSPNMDNRRLSLTPGGTTKVLADLQTGVINARNALENTKAQLRLSQRSVAQLTRQTEDLKEVRERLRLENEGLNNVVARKERLLQEVLERARKAEAETTVLKSQLKAETTSSKKSLREMEAALAESTALSSKSEREYIILRDSLKGMKNAWRTDIDSLREDMRKREERLRGEVEAAGKKYAKLLEESKARNADVLNVEQLREDDARIRREVEEEVREQISALKEQVKRSSEASEKAGKTAEHLAGELARLRRLMRSTGQPAPESSPT
ncbi:hypothetical protein B0F90DRAFT_1623930 [Multifurca ochricompacta]|uniref:SWI5-dependent HO expression protein 3 n=1 Tax=Multifurca ochricompacta TaxID=376703 RepID=A0AAD4M971_9AGAM|nr:hypothetical protein B0F90DRAFT_1623930 [Multifurca ochricompacta]